ncbi:HdeD family acid-resistance protein [Bartonella tamiae]|uniref:HdeD family acid-resistance protein n=1 Tax=Bartonella tamiae Th239 TaxID=1094558 RepID=J0R659_9HYPH|nr:HdeD family acid-resistance protein [Bartonella tamiae]EJF91189.1 hypothetical protein ME5_00521 [Bartonella tamiae Th239]EJF93146.1 hypothetical protein MEG_01360 [Bartonella tamiae Th307]
MVQADNINLAQNGRELSGKWGWFMAMGVFLLIVGLIAAIALPFATAAVAIYIGIMMVIGGVIQLIHAFSLQSWGRFILWLLAGLLYTVAGVICFTQPILAASIFTFILGFLLIVNGVIRVIVGLQSRQYSSWGWIVAAGLISGLLGILIITGWPANTLWVLGLFLAIDLIFQGWSWIAFSIGLRSIKHNLS